MPLIVIPDHIRQTILFDFALKEQNNTINTFNGIASNNKNISNPVRSKKNQCSLFKSPLLIYSANGRTLFEDKENEKENHNEIDHFIYENNICNFETFLNTVKTGSLEQLLQLNFLRNHLSYQDEHGNNALIWATLFNFDVIIKYLLDNKSQVDICNNYHWRAIDIAAFQGNKTAFAHLINQGACEYLDEQDCTALYQAQQNGHIEIVDLLQAKIKQNYDEHLERTRFRVSFRL